MWGVPLSIGNDVMTKNKRFKRRVRARMDHTGESYAAAKAALLKSKAEAQPTAGPIIGLAMARPQPGHGLAMAFAMDWA